MRHLFLPLVFISTSLAAQAAVLDVQVQNVRNDHGHVLVAVCPAADFLHMQCPYVASAPSHTGTVVVRVTGIPPGIYAVQAFQDENDNKKIDRNFFGMPTEGIGFSRDAPFHFGPPRFGDAAIQLGPAGGQIAIHLRYF